MSAPDARPRNESVDTARGIACILLVGFHVIGATPEHGIRAADDSFIRLGIDVLGYVRMPLFTFLSGVVYAMAPLHAGAVTRFASGKARRILIPFAVATFFYFLASLAADRGELIYGLNPWPYLVYPFMHLWFLQAILVVFAVVAVLDRFRLLETYGRWAGALAIAIGGMLLAPEATNFFSINRALELMPFFFLGLAVTRFPGIMYGRAALPIGVGAAAVGLSGAAVQATGSADLPHVATAMARLAAGGGVPVVLLGAGIAWTYLAQLGRSSLVIYIYHVAAIAASRRLLAAVDMDQPVSLFAAGLAAGLAAPMFLEWLARHHAATRLAILGLKSRQSPTGFAG